MTGKSPQWGVNETKITRKSGSPPNQDCPLSRFRRHYDKIAAFFEAASRCSAVPSSALARPARRRNEDFDRDKPTRTFIAGNPAGSLPRQSPALTNDCPCQPAIAD